MKTFLGCLGLAVIAVVFIGVAAATSFTTGLVVLGVLLATWFAAVLWLSAKADALRKAEREAVRAREVAEHHAFMAAREAQQRAHAAQLEAARVARYEGLCARFGERTADAIMAGRYWQGATVEMMHEALGQPEDVKEKVFKTKTSATHYYRQISAQRYGLKIFFEDGVVVGWED